MENGTKNRILYLYRYLILNTDQEHPLTTAELMTAMKEKYGIPVSRNTINDDLNVLIDSDLDIERRKSSQNRYYYTGQTYDLAELKVLVDAISASKFITQKKSDVLISKLMKLTSTQSASDLCRHVHTYGRAKSDNESGYYIADSINEAINAHRKIRFCYTDFDVNKNRYITNNGEPYTVSPYSLIWDGDYYYVRGFCDERREMRNFRLDRIHKQPDILYDQPAVVLREEFSPVDYSKQTFRMYDTDEPVTVKLLCHVSVMKYIIDNFGRDVRTTVVDDEHFTAVVSVYASTTFFRWIFGFSGKIRILGPEKVREEYMEKLKKALEEG